MVPGQVIVQWRVDEASARAAAAEHRLRLNGHFDSQRLNALYDFDTSRGLEKQHRVIQGPDTAETLEVIRRVCRDPRTDYAQPNYVKTFNTGGF